MILYKLQCSHGHTFDAWFRDGATYDAQSASGDVECPFCGDITVSKAPMAPRLVRSPKSDASDGTHPTTDVAEAARQAERVVLEVENAGGDGRAAEVAEQILKAVNMLRDYVERNYEDVGDGFANEARRIHHGEAEERGIYGSATEDETKALTEEGIEHVRLPAAPRKSGH